jgi:glycosyltransferase involved in cell wall biosynthesis
MPIRNEATFIGRSLRSVLAQDYPSELVEIIVADGMSTDGTNQIVSSFAAEHTQLRLINNPGKIASTGLNTALRLARGDIVVRVDGHCEIAADYLRRCVDGLRIGGIDAVGGPIQTVGETPIARVIAAAMSSNFGVGGAAFRTKKYQKMFVDTLAFPAYTRQALEKAGLFDEEMIRDQDDEYNYRLRELGGRLLLLPQIRCRYYSRSNLRSLWRQYFQYGYYKVRVMQKHPRQMRSRHFVPPVFVAALLTASILGMFSVWAQLTLEAIISMYLAANVGASVLIAKRSAGSSVFFLPLIFGVLHLGYGFGFIAGLLKFWNRWGDQQWRTKLLPPRPQAAE